VKAEGKADLFRQLPSIDELVRRPGLLSFIASDGLTAVTDAVRSVVTSLRDEIASGRLDARGIELALSGIDEAVTRELRRALQFSLHTVINATGVILHTNLGRAPLSPAALDHVMDIASGYSNLEFDTVSGERGNRDFHVDRLFRKLLPPAIGAGSGGYAVSTIVVNNNAAAVLLALNTLAENGEVIVSRGELVEIGGSFRIPDVMAKSHAVLCEVGTTNRTRVSDYEAAITGKTRLLLRVHRSNFQITGFTEQPPLQDLVNLAHAHNLPLMEDLGSGALVDLNSVGIGGEPSVLDSLRAGVNLVTYSGDKLLGGPQAGMLSGDSRLVARMRSNSLFRALRVDKMTYAALEAILLAYVRSDHDAIPALRMMRQSKQEIYKRAGMVAESVRSAGVSVELVDGESIVGGGAAPSAVLATSLLAVTCHCLAADALSARLRTGDPPVIARVEDGRLLLDLRSVFPRQDEALVRALRQASGA